MIEDLIVKILVTLIVGALAWILSPFRIPGRVRDWIHSKWFSDCEPARQLQLLNSSKPSSDSGAIARLTAEHALALVDLEKRIREELSVKTRADIADIDEKLRQIDRDLPRHEADGKRAIERFERTRSKRADDRLFNMVGPEPKNLRNADLKRAVEIELDQELELLKRSYFDPAENLRATRLRLEKQRDELTHTLPAGASPATPPSASPAASRPPETTPPGSG